MISPAQELVLQLIACAQFNNLVGQRVAADLRASKRLWRAAILTRQVTPFWRKLENPVTSAEPPAPLEARVNLYALRDLPSGDVNLDTLYVWSEPGCQDELEQLANGWEADEVAWWSAKDSMRALGMSRFGLAPFRPEDRMLLHVWWD